MTETVPTAQMLIRVDADTSPLDAKLDVLEARLKRIDALGDDIGLRVIAKIQGKFAELFGPASPTDQPVAPVEQPVVEQPAPAEQPAVVPAPVEAPTDGAPAQSEPAV